MFNKTSPEEKLRWRQQIEEQRTSGLSILEWCRRKNLRYHTFLYWRDKLPDSNQPLSRGRFRELLPDTNPSGEASGVIIEYHGLRLILNKQFDEQTFLRCLASLKSLPC